MKKQIINHNYSSNLHTQKLKLNQLKTNYLQLKKHRKKKAITNLIYL
jgi:hypothetical protein